MSAAREEILARVRSADCDVPTGAEAEAPIPRDYRQRSAESRDAIVERFAERVAEYRATVQSVPASELSAGIEAALRRRHVRRLVIPADLPEEWLPGEIELVRDGQLSAESLDASDGVLTGCAAGIAETGTIVLDGGPRQGRRAITLVPDYHLCIVEAIQIVGLVPEAIALLHEAAAQCRPITLISGPSATSDIELSRVEGVHGPRTLDVLIVGGETG
jgi:L-lactate dehydrogenase complex protein LldG